MHLKIIFIGLDEKIVFNKGIIEEVNDGCKKVYYKFNDDTVEALFLHEEHLEITKLLSDCDIVVIGESKNLKAEHIERIKNNKDIIVIFGEKNKEVVKYEKEFIFPDLSKKDKINIYDIILTTYNIFEYKSTLHGKYGISGIIGFSEKECLGQNILVNILNEFKVIEKCSKYSLNLFLKEKLGVDEIAYIEDSIIEYTYNNSSFKIKQNTNEIYKDKIYFAMIGI